MSVDDPTDLVFRSRALAQTHPYTRTAQRYLTTTMARERKEQPVPEMAMWATNAITVGYCLRRVEEEENGQPPDWETDPPRIEVAILDERSSELADKVRSEQAQDFVLFPQEKVIETLDKIIFGEIDRRISTLAGKVDQQVFEELESYIGWWTLKGYCLRVAEQLVAAEGDGGATG